MASEIETDFTIEFKDFNGIDCSIQKSSIATEECIWLGCSELGLLGLRPNEGWTPIQEDSLGFKHVQGNNRMHLTREQVGELIPFLQTFYLDGKIEYRDEDTTETEKVIGDDWIPVSERLPEKDGKYDVTLHNKNYSGNKPYVETAWFKNKQWYFDRLCLDGITAWKERTSPYDPKEKTMSEKTIERTWANVIDRLNESQTENTILRQELADAKEQLARERQFICKKCGLRQELGEKPEVRF